MSLGFPGQKGGGANWAYTYSIAQKGELMKEGKNTPHSFCFTNHITRLTSTTSTMLRSRANSALYLLCRICNEPTILSFTVGVKSPTNVIELSEITTTTTYEFSHHFCISVFAIRPALFLLLNRPQGKTASHRGTSNGVEKRYGEHRGTAIIGSSLSRY